jgi:phenylalanyl-tRNA synthetase alpha subunit
LEASIDSSPKRQEKISERILRGRAQKEENAKSNTSNTKGKKMGFGIKIAIAAILFSVISGGYFYIQALQGKLEAAAEVQQRMEGVITQQKMVMEQQQADMKKMQAINAEVAKVAQQAQNDVNALNRKFQQRDLAMSAAKKPADVEIRVNRGTRDALRCNELVTGAPLTPDELSGKAKNNICQNIIDRQIPKKEAAK